MAAFNALVLSRAANRGLNEHSISPEMVYVPNTKRMAFFRICILYCFMSGIVGYVDLRPGMSFMKLFMSSKAVVVCI